MIWGAQVGTPYDDECLVKEKKAEALAEEQERASCGC